ncbi:MAG: FecR family protein [Pseudomonadota bacterium]
MSLPPPTDSAPWSHSDRLRALDEALQPDEPAMKRVMAGLPARRQACRARQRNLRLAMAGGAALAAGLVAWALSHSGPPAPVALSSPEQATIQPVTGLRLSHEGEGSMAFEEDQLVIDWVRGRLGVDLDPGARRHLEVHSPEARIEVLGTAFTVERDGLGTSLTMARGTVATWCHEQPGPTLSAGATWRCFRSGASALHEARTLQGQGAEPAAVRAVVEQGLAIPDTPPGTRDELAVLRIALLSDGGEAGAALEAARAYLATGSALRRPEVELIVARLGGMISPEP